LLGARGGNWDRDVGASYARTQNLSAESQLTKDCPVAQYFPKRNSTL